MWGIILWTRQCAHSDCVALWKLNFQYGGESARNWPILTEYSVKVRPFLFPFTIGKSDLNYSECVKVFLYVLSCFFMVLKEKRYHGLLVCNWSLFFEKVKLDVRRSLEPLKYIDGRFDPSLPALTKRSQTPSNSTCVSRILDASV